MPIYKPSLIDKIRDFVDGIRANWEAYEQHVADFEEHVTNFEDHRNASVEDNVHNLRNNIIVESGSNANGNYIKFGDGTLICYGALNRTLNITTAIGSLYRNENDTLIITFPVSFYNTPPILNVFNRGSATVFFANQTSVTVSEARLYVLRPTSIESITLQVGWCAIGRWR